MPDDNRIDPQHRPIRDALRVVGPVVLVISGLLMVGGAVDFFASFGSVQPPTRFWTCFVGMPLLFVGGVLTMYG